MRNNFKAMRVLTLVLAVMMIVTSMPVGVLAKVNYDDLTSDKPKFVNELIPVKPAKPEDGKTAADLIKNPDQPAIYTLRTDYKVQRGEKYEVDYQPYIASVGEAATQAEKDKVNQTVKLPDLTGYEKPDDDYKIDYKTVKDAADGKGQTGDATNGFRYQADEDFRYKSKANDITIKHVFQDLHDFTKYTNPDGSVGEEGQLITTQNGNTGSTMEVSPLDGKHTNRKGFVPEAPFITMQVPENAEEFVLEYRYNRAHYDVQFDTKGGTPVPSRTLYYEQIIPKIDDTSIPKKAGSDFLGWMPSITLETTGGKTYPENEIIKDSTGKPILNLAADLKMPASKITFTAVWKDKPKADYAIQFWAEKADHADNASIMDKYEYMGTRVYKDVDTGSRPNLDTEPVKGLKFPDLDQARLQKIWNGEKFNKRRNNFIDKFFVYNQALTHDQNKDPANVNLVKSVDSTGKTVYNIYYDRQVYDLYFTKSNAQPDKNTIYPEIWGYDPAKGEAVMLGGPGKPYHYKARFNEMMYKWPNDAKQTKGFTPGYQSFGWGPNYTAPNWPLHLDTPPYRLNADEFLDMANYTTWGGYTKHIDKGDGTTMNLDKFDFTTLSFGIKQDKPSIPHHMDFWMDGFKDGETIIRYDLVRTKADTASLSYGHRYPRVQGFTPYGYKPRAAWPAIEEGSEENGRVNEDEINDLNDERDEITPNNSGSYYNNNGIKLPIGQLDFIPVFYSDQDGYGDPKDGGQAFTENGYLQFKYTRNKYPLRFNYDPSKIKDDSEFNSKNQLDAFYEFPLKALSPDVDENDEYKKVGTKEGPKNLIDNPENLQQLGLKDLVFTDPQDNKLKVKRPDNLSDQMVFKGWALDPAGTKLIWENPKETMPTHPVNLYAKWGEPDYKWKVTFDPDGGKLKTIKEEKLTTERKTIQEGDIGQEEVNTYAKKGYLKEGPTTPDGKQIFTVIQRQKLVEPKFVPEKKGYDFMGWEVIRYKKDEKGDYTTEIDDSYRKTYKVPELYSFGNDVVSPIYLKAIWVPNQRVDVDVLHYYLDKDYNLDTNISPNPDPDKLENKRAGYLVATTGDRQDDKYILAPADELDEKLTGDLKKEYEEYNNRVKLNNSFFQTFRVEPEKILNTETNQMEENPNAKNNVFKFFYRPYRQREYKVNYIDERFKGKETEEGAAIIDQEIVKNGNRHFDARNYRQIPGWKLTSDPQQQLFFDLNEETNEFLGINGTGKDEITFYYKDVRVIEIPTPPEGQEIPDPPKGYVRVTFKADKGGSFGKDAEGNDITELHYDVIKGLKSDLLPIPKELKEGEEKEEGKYYITPDAGKKFIKWANKPLLNKNTLIENEDKDFYVFTAYFEWSGLSAKGLVRTEAFKDPKGKWTNDFAPTIVQLKAQLVWREKDVVKPLPTGTTIEFFDEAGNKLTTNDQVYNLVNEKKAADKDELDRTVNIKAKVTFTDGKEPQELIIPITVYKNVYEALNKEGDKPLFLTEAEKKDAKDGGLKEILKDNTENRYIKVTIKPNKDFDNKDDKVYYVNPNAWVEIPEVKTDGDSNFTNWTANIDAQNEEGKKDGIFNFGKRHKFTEDTIITPVGAGDVVEQTDPNKKPDVPNSYVKVIVKTTDKATDATAFEKTFWVNPTKEVTIDVTNPTGKENQKFTFDGLGEKTVNYIFKEWQKVQTGEADDSLTDVTPATKIDLAKNQYTDKVTVIEAAYKKSIQAEEIEDQLKTTKLDTPQGKEITNDDLIKQITPQEGKEIESIEVISKPDGNTVGNEPAKVTIKYKDGTTQGTNDNPVVIPVEVHKNIIPEVISGQKPKDALDNYVKVIFKAGTGGTVSGDLVYYVSPEVEVDMTESAGKITKTPDVGYTANGEKWTNKDNKTLKGTFKDSETEFVFNFDKSKDIVEKTDDPNQVIPEGYVKVTFKTDGNGKVGGADEKIYYVNPKAGIKLGKTATDDNKTLVVPTPTANDNFTFKEWQEIIDENTPITNDRTHVAIFQSGQVTLTYEKGGDDVTGDVPAAAAVNYGTTVGLAGKGTLEKPNATFAGWKLDGEDKIYQPGDQVTLEKARTATAQWKSVEYKVTFDSKGGNNVPSQTVEHGKTATKPEAPKLDGKVFMGWKEKETDENYFNFNTAITGDKTLIAIWQDSVQMINDGDPVEDQFIKVTFNEGTHGKLKLTDAEQEKPVTYKVAKDYTLDQAVQSGLEIPEIAPDKYYKAVDTNNGWDNELNLTLAAGETEKVFTAQYEPIEDVIPVDPQVTDEEEIQKEKPEGMVLVEFVVDETKAYMEGITKYYVKKNIEVEVPSPIVFNKISDNEFKGWVFNNEVTMKIKGSFSQDTVISDKVLEKPTIYIKVPTAGEDLVRIEDISADARGKLEVINNGQSKVYYDSMETVRVRQGRKFVNVEIHGFKLDNPLQSGDLIKFWAINDNGESDIYKYIIE